MKLPKDGNIKNGQRFATATNERDDEVSRDHGFFPRLRLVSRSKPKLPYEPPVIETFYPVAIGLPPGVQGDKKLPLAEQHATETSGHWKTIAPEASHNATEA